MHIRISHPVIDQMPSADAGYARHVGRIGALAVALGVGAAVATSLGAGTALADDTGSAGASTASDSSTSTSDRSRRTGADTAKRAADKPRLSTRTATQTEERSTRESTSTSTLSTAATRETAAPAGKRRTAPISVRTASGAKRAVADRAPTQSQHSVPVASPARTTLDAAPAALDDDAVPAPELAGAATSVEVTEAVSTPSPSTAADDTTPAESPALWALLAWTRRAAAENIETVGAVATSVVTTGENTEVLETTEASGVTVGAGNTTAIGEVTAVGDTTGAEHTETAVEVIGPLLPGDTATVSLSPDANGEYHFDLRSITQPLLGITAFQILTPPLHGWVELSYDGIVTYVPDPNYAGADTFTVSTRSLIGLIVGPIVTFEVSVPAPNQIPWAENPTYTVPAGETLAGNMLQYSGGGDGPLRVDLIDTPRYGTVQMSSDGTFVYTPHYGFAGADTFTYAVTDIDGDRAIGTVTIVVHSTPPVAFDDAVTVTVGDTVEIRVLDNDQHSGGELTIELVGNPAYGHVEYDSTTGIFTYTARLNQAQGFDSFTYSITDVYGDTSTATVTIRVEARPPVAIDDTATVTAGEKVVIDVLKNDQHSGAELKVELIRKPAYGDIAYDPVTRTFTYIAGANQSQDSDTFSYSITDGNGNTSTATVHIKILVKPTGPTARDDWASTPNTSPVTIDVLANDDAPGEKPPTVRIDTPPRSGKVELLDGKLVYTPDPGFAGSVTIGYSITDPRGVTSRATVTVVVTGKAIDHHFSTNQGSTLHVPGIEGLLSHPGHEGWTVSMAQGPGRGKVELNDDGTFSYTPEPGFVGEDNFVVYVSDGKTETKMNVYIDVAAAPNEPEPEPEAPQPVVQPVGFTASALALGGGRTTAECTDYWWPEIVDPDTVWPTCTLLYVRDDVNQVR